MRRHEDPLTTERLGAWLARSPGGSLPYRGDGATETVETLADGWASAVVHALAAEPRSVATLAEYGGDAEPETVERLLERMRWRGLVERRAGRHGEARYLLTEWACEGIGPLIAAARHERIHATARAAQVDALDVVAAYQLSLPLLRLSRHLSGVCRLVVELDDRGPAGVEVEVAQGRVVRCEPDSGGAAGAIVSGGLRAWFHAVIEGGVRRLEIEGEHELGRSLPAGMHENLFRS